jgi:hypothetical protein
MNAVELLSLVNFAAALEADAVARVLSRCPFARLALPRLARLALALLEEGSIARTCPVNLSSRGVQIWFLDAVLRLDTLARVDTAFVLSLARGVSHR